MSNEEKILSMLAELQADVKSLKSDVASLKEKKASDELAKLSPEERTARQLAALDAIYNSTVDEEEPEATAKFFALMDEKEARRSAS